MRSWRHDTLKSWRNVSFGKTGKDTPRWGPMGPLGVIWSSACVVVPYSRPLLLPPSLLFSFFLTSHRQRLSTLAQFY